MLKKKYRLRNSSAFCATLKLKNCKSDDFFTIYKGKLKTNFAVPTKIGIIVSKKLHKRAVKRNKIKRRIRAIYQEAFKSGYADNVQDSLSLIFIARPKVIDANFSTLKISILKLLKRF